MIGVREVGELRAAAVALAAGLDPSMAAGHEAAVVVEHAVASKNIACFIESTYAARVAETDEWRRSGARSEAEWLSQRTGSTTAAASERIRAGQRLGRQPEVQQAAVRGDLSAEQTAAITDAVAADPEAGERLLGKAEKSSLRDLRDACDRTKTAADPDPAATHDRIRKERKLRFWARAGVASLFANTTPEQMAVIKSAIEARADELFHAARKAGDPQPAEHYLMDALEHICRQFFGHTLDHTNDDGAAAPRGRTTPIFLGLVRVDHAALLRGHTEGEELCEITGLGPVPVSVARELLGESLLYLVMTKGTAVANVVNIKRGPKVAQRMALLWSSPLCSITACDRIHVERDHAIPWAASKQTRLEDLQHLCDHHHDLKSHHGWDVVDEADSTRVMVPPDDPRHPANSPPGEHQQDTDAA